MNKSPKPNDGYDNTKKIHQKIKELENIKNLTELLIELDRERIKIPDVKSTTKDDTEQYVKELPKNDAAPVQVACNGDDDMEENKPTVAIVKRGCKQITEVAKVLFKRTLCQKERCFLMSEAVVNILNHKKILQDRLHLLYRPNKGAGEGGKKFSALKKKRHGLERKIECLRDSYERLVQLDVERQNKVPSKTLDEYMEIKLKACHSKIDNMKENILKYNRQLSNIASMIDVRQQEMSELKRAIKNKASSTINESKEYQKLIDNNKQLKQKLDDLLLSQDTITEETRRVLNAIEEEKRNKDILPPEELAIRDSLHLLDEQYESRTLREPIDDEIIAELEKQVWARDVCLAHLQTKTMKLKGSLEQEKDTVNGIKEEIKELTEENAKILRLVSTSTHEELQRTRYMCP